MEKAEKILSEQERQGYRFVRLRWRYLFTFQKSTPREVRYIFTYTLPKDNWPALEWERTLKSDMYRANEMYQGYGYGIFRITKDNVDLRDICIDRLQYVRKTLIIKTIIATYMMLSGAIVAFSGDFSLIGRLFSMFIFVGGLSELLSYIVGFYSTSQKKKKLIYKKNSI